MATLQLYGIPGYEEFKSTCSFFFCGEEYPGWSGTEKSAVITAFSKEELNEKFPQIMEILSPYMILSPEQGEAIMESKRNDHKFKMREIRAGSVFGFDEKTSECHEEAADESFEEDLLNRLILQKSMTVLTEIQRQRITEHFFHHLSFREIAEMQSTDPSAVRESVTSGIKKMKKHFA